MKKLLLIRHAKATHEPGYVDFERPLKYSGLEDAGLMAARLQKNSIIPQMLVASPALRTLSTADVFAEHLSLPKPHTEKKIYDAALETLMEVVNDFPSDKSFIALVGHNPGITQLLYFLTGEAKEMDTCALALIEFDLDDWDAIGHVSGKMVYYDSPQ